MMSATVFHIVEQDGDIELVHLEPIKKIISPRPNNYQTYFKTSIYTKPKCRRSLEIKESPDRNNTDNNLNKVNNFSAQLINQLTSHSYRMNVRTLMGKVANQTIRQVPQKSPDRKSQKLPDLK